MPEIVSFWRLDASEIDGRFMRADDVIAWAKLIRAAVAAERASDPAVNHRCDCPFGWCDGGCPTLTARAALDALLAGGGA